MVYRLVLIHFIGAGMKFFYICQAQNFKDMNYRLIEVNDKKSARQFLDVMRVLYRGDKNFICPLDTIIEEVFDPAGNTFFSHGEAAR